MGGGRGKAALLYNFEKIVKIKKFLSNSPPDLTT
jgi:hypothetical protein